MLGYAAVRRQITEQPHTQISPFPHSNTCEGQGQSFFSSFPSLMLCSPLPDSSHNPFPVLFPPHLKSSMGLLGNRSSIFFSPGFGKVGFAAMDFAL